MAKCDKCDKPATVYLTEILEGQKIQKHLCEECAASEGITVKTNVPISQLLEEFVLQSSGGPALAELKCDVCGMTFKEFRQQGLLGCPHDYEVFSRPLENLLQRAHEGAVQHIGKTPGKAGSDVERHTSILRLRGELREAVTAEDYERAASLRDQIKQLEKP
jgi:protein arginine kinase activator